MPTAPERGVGEKFAERSGDEVEEKEVEGREGESLSEWRRGSRHDSTGFFCSLGRLLVACFAACNHS